MLLELYKKVYHFIFPNMEEIVKTSSLNVINDSISYINKYIDLEDIKEVHSLYHGPSKPASRDVAE